MFFILSGLHADATERSVHDGLAPYFSVRQVRFVREGEADSPWAMVEVDDDDEKVRTVTSRMRGVFHRGKALQIYIPAHQPQAHADLGQDGDSIHID